MSFGQLISGNELQITPRGSLVEAKVAVFDVSCVVVGGQVVMYGYGRA